MLVLGYTVAPGGIALIVLGLLLVAVLPSVLLWKVSEARGQSRAHALWGLLVFVGFVAGLRADLVWALLLGILGLALGLLVMMAIPRGGGGAPAGGV